MCLEYLDIVATIECLEAYKGIILKLEPEDDLEIELKLYRLKVIDNLLKRYIRYSKRKEG